MLEYSSTVWNPFYKNSSNRIEKVQKKFTRYLIFKLNWRMDMPTYEIRCLLFGIKTLENRRTCFSVIFIRDILSYHIKCPQLLRFVNLRVPQRDFRNSNLLLEYFHRTNYGLNEPISRCIRETNLVCSRIDIFSNCTRDTFKMNLLNIIVIQSV